MNKWTDDEKDFVLSQFKLGKTVDEIFNMNKIKRSRYAIECKIYGHIYDLIQSGSTHKNIAKEFDRTKEEIKEIEQKAFEMRNKSDNKTMYTQDGGYVYGEKKSNIIDLNDFHHINRTMNTVLSYYENINRLNILKTNKIIDDQFYTDLMKKLNEFTFDKQKIIDSIDLSNLNSNNKNEKVINNVEKEIVSDKKDNIKITSDKKKSKNIDNDDDNFDESTIVKKLKKRI